MSIRANSVLRNSYKINKVKEIDTINITKLSHSKSYLSKLPIHITPIVKCRNDDDDDTIANNFKYRTFLLKNLLIANIIVVIEKSAIKEITSPLQI